MTPPLVKKGELEQIQIDLYIVTDTAGKKQKNLCFCSNSGNIRGFSTIWSVFFLSHFCSQKANTFQRCCDALNEIGLTPLEGRLLHPPWKHLHCQCGRLTIALMLYWCCSIARAEGRETCKKIKAFFYGTCLITRCSRGTWEMALNLENQLGKNAVKRIYAVTSLTIHWMAFSPELWTVTTLP